MIKKERIASKIFKNMVWHFAGRENELFLTFDDGPTPEITPWVLDTLAQHNAKATFFCIGEKVLANPEIYKRIIDEGHSVGNHSFSHLKGWNTTNSSYLNDIRKATECIESNLFRPPFGRIKPGQSFELKKDFHIIMWDVLSKDYDETVDEKKCLYYVLNHTEEGSIIVFHDTKQAEKNLKYVLPEALKTFSSQGFVFNAIELKN